MERAIRIGKDFNVRWSIRKVMDGERQPYELAGKELVLQYRRPNGTLHEAKEWRVDGNIIIWTFRGRDQKAPGSYQLILTENGGKDGMVTVDTCRAFKLVEHSCEETEGSGSDIVIEDVVLESEVAFAPIVIQDGGESYDDTEIKKDIADLQAKDTQHDAKLAELSVETMTLQYPELIDVTHLFFRDGLFANNLSQGRFSPNKNISGGGGKYCAVFKTKVGDIFEIVNLKGASSTKAWYKYDATGKIISNADASVTINETLVMEHEGYIVFNHYGTPSDVFSVKTTAEIFPVNAIVGLKNLRDDFEAFKTEIPQVANGFGGDTTKAISQSFFTDVLYPLVQKIDLTQQSVAGYMKTSVGSAPSIVSHATRRHIILDVQKGDTFSYDATGGSAGRAIAYVKDGIVTYASDSGAIKAEVVADGTFDQIIFNYGSAYPAKILKFGTTIEIPQSEYKKPLEGKNIVIFGDSSTAGSASSGTNWFNRMCEDLGAEKYRNYASGGQTILNQEGVTTNYLKASIETAISNINSQWDGKVDVIMLQIGGNDIDYMAQKGSIEEAFASRNYLSYKDDKTIYGSLRYCLEHLQRTFPDALITMGTVFGRLGSDIFGGTKEINEIITNCCDVLKIQVIDGGKYMGFSYLELNYPYYNDVNSGVANDRTALSRENPAYNYLDANGNIVTYEEATDNGTLKNGYTKRYGLYTYDGKHQTQRGEDKVKNFMQAQIAGFVE